MGKMATKKWIPAPTGEEKMKPGHGCKPGGSSQGKAKEVLTTERRKNFF